MRKVERLALQERIRKAIISNPGMTAAELAPRFGVCVDVVSLVAKKFGLELTRAVFFTRKEQRRMIAEDNRNWGYLGECYPKPTCTLYGRRSRP